MIGSESSSAMGRIDSWPWRGSRIKPEMKDDAAEEGYDISMRYDEEIKKGHTAPDLMATVGNLTERVSKNPFLP